MNVQFPLVPKNPETMNMIHEILSAPVDNPIVEMNDQTARDMEIISQSMADIATRWRGRMDCRLPGMPINKKDYWGIFANDGKGNHQLLPAVKDFIKNTLGCGKVAIDLGCGDSPAAAFLLQRGWRVIAVDNSPSALNVFREMHEREIASGQLTIVEADATEFNPEEPVDLVIAADIFQYIDPAQFLKTLAKVHDLFLKDKGILIGSLFRSPPLPATELHIIQMNVLKEMGGWFLPDRRMARPILKNAGYEIKSCTYRQERVGQPICIQFIAEKKL